MKTQQLVSLFKALTGTNKTILFADLMRKGYSSVLIKNAIELTGASMDLNTEGYTIITF